MAPSGTPLGETRIVAGKITTCGYISMMGAIKTEGKLPGGIREAMILRVAAMNHTASEWIQHEGMARLNGLSHAQLFGIRSIEIPFGHVITSPPSNIFNDLQTSALAFTDSSTNSVRVPMPLIMELKRQLKIWATSANPSMSLDELEATTDELYAEAVMIVAAYNMVSRFLAATDVGGLSDVEVPWPKDENSNVPLTGALPHPVAPHAQHLQPWRSLFIQSPTIVPLSINGFQELPPLPKESESGSISSTVSKYSMSPPLRNTASLGGVHLGHSPATTNLKRVINHLISQRATTHVPSTTQISQSSKAHSQLSLKFLPPLPRASGSGSTSSGNSTGYCRKVSRIPVAIYPDLFDKQSTASFLTSWCLDIEGAQSFESIYR